MAEATAKAFCDIFGVRFIDPYKKGEVTIMGKVVNRDELVAWIDAHAVEVEDQKEPEIKPEPVTIKAGDKVVFKAGVTQWGTGSSGKSIPAWAQDGKTVFTVLEIVKDGAEARIGNAAGAYSGTAYIKEPMGITWSQIITPLLVAALTAIVGGFWRYISKRLKDIKITYTVLQEAQRDTMRYQIVQAHDYFMGKGCIGKYSLDCIEAMYESYHKLGGNGFIHSIMTEIRALPIK